MAQDEENVLANKHIALLIATLSTVAEFNPDFHKVAEKVGISHGRTAQQKFKKLIESTNKYALVNGKVVDLEVASDGAAAKTLNKKAAKAKATSTPRSTTTRKRKAIKDLSEDDSDAEECTPAKKRSASTPRGAAKKTLKKETTPSEDEDDDDVEEIEEPTPATNGSGVAPAQANSGDDDEDSEKEGGD